MDKIKKRFILISEGAHLKDKLKILISVLSLNRYKPQVYLKNKDGTFLVRKNSSDLWMLSTLGEYEIRKYFYLDKGTFLDIGANVGKYSIILSKMLEKENGQVYSFEPEPNNLRALKENLILNEIKNIKIIPLACSDSKDYVEFYLDKKNTGGHSLINETDEKIKVRTDTLDNLIKINKIKNIRLIKIDTEGAEEKILRGASNTLEKFHPRIIFETENIDRISLILKGYNYKIKKISKRDYFAE